MTRITGSTRDACPGDVICVHDQDTGMERRLVVRENQPDGVMCLWVCPRGMGPYQIVLPHGNTTQLVYEREAGGDGSSYWDTHSDFTGNTREF